MSANHDNEEGFFTTLRKNTPAVLRDNAPRVVAGLKIASAASMLFDKENPAFQGAGICQGLGYIVIAAFGHKKTEEEKEALRADGDAPDNGIASIIGKVVQPHKYPIESGMALDTASDVLWTISGKNDSSKWGGILNVIADINIIATKEDTMTPNPHVKGSIPYYISEFKRRPVLLSSALNIACDSYTVATGTRKFLNNPEQYPSSMIAGGFLLAGNLVQAIYVDKNDYNIEKTATEPTTSVSESETSSRITEAQPKRLAYA